jgi:hypothetical protein
MRVCVCVLSALFTPQSVLLRGLDADPMQRPHICEIVDALRGAEGELLRLQREEEQEQWVQELLQTALGDE